MKKPDERQMRKDYVKPEITSYEVEQDAYACGSPGQEAKWLEWTLLFGCCDTSIMPVVCCR